MDKNFIGKWYFTERTGYDVNPSDPGFIVFDPEGHAAFEFDVTCGHMICSYGPNIVHFNWEGSSECDPFYGEGWAELDEHNTQMMAGSIEFINGDEIEFKAIRYGSENTKDASIQR